MSDPFVIVGGGLTAAKAVETLRGVGDAPAGGEGAPDERGGAHYDGRIIVYGAEAHVPYERPPLSKGYLMGEADIDSAFVHGAQWYREHDVELRLGTHVTALDVGAHRVLAGEQSQSYDRLLLATGSSPRRMALAEESGAPMTYLRTIEDSRRIKSCLRPGGRVAVIGAGWIGLEIASAARAAGTEVTILETQELPLLRVLGPEVAEIFASLHRAHGADLRLGVQVTDVESAGERAVVRLGDGSAVEADLLVVGVGASPNTALAEAAGLETDNGIVVDEYLRTADPDVFAAGDVAAALHPALGRRIRVEHWDNAIHQGSVAARNMMGQGVAYDRVPYFYTDQYDLGMEYVGNVGPEGYDEVILRGDVAGDLVFTAFWMSGGHVLAGMHANDWDAIGPIRDIVGATVDPLRLRDASVPLADIQVLGTSSAG